VSPTDIELANLSITLVVEVPVAAWLAGRGARARFGWAVVFANLVSHPLASTFLPTSASPSVTSDWLLVEGLVIAFEGLAMQLATGAPPWIVWRAVGVANAASAVVGLVWSGSRVFPFRA